MRKIITPIIIILALAAIFVRLAHLPHSHTSYNRFIRQPAVISWQDAGKYYGQDKSVEGIIVATHRTAKFCFLDFSSNWEKDFTSVIFDSDFNSFPPNPEVFYKGKKVRVTGTIKEYKGKPEIILKDKSQIKIVE
jgi:micrococcal nuclease